MTAPPCAARPGDCRYGTAPELVLDTGNHHMPQVEIWRCTACGHGVTRPAMADVSPLYAGRESDDYLARDSGWIQSLKRIATRRLARRLIAFAPAPPRRIADFGTGNGMLARALADAAGPDATVHALDFFDDPPGPLDPVRYASFAAAAPLHGTMDLVTCFHVLEHDDDSAAMLARVLAFVRPGGTLVIEVPNVDCVWNPWFGKACANWYAPFHRVHFTRASLRALLVRQGLEIVAEQDICGPTFALSLAQWLAVRPNGLLFALALGLRPLQWVAERLTRRPSALRIIARRPG
ncbi:class I SAM-dependent methyltransferase [Novosphingobium flavum]|uniref:Class I SAM-dependent methyltransferase n=1 Tax=Novosphingobium aerophilum TaxID=2839843 RepID=A0A7X1F7N4_9SPHN|nr:class I SAM-dependent methyltransferase [Novosphingobium aerophilum]MBC2651868.1 class I SAM-dependent methyltransferase [Novosphingobium aerophilum]MBC2661733.1 class I SAM-dependent methyltransferase [Novosphingobium aerophilum]